MNPVVVDVGPIELRAYSAWLMAGVLGGLLILVWRAYRFAPPAVPRWLDAGIAGVVAGMIGARVLHVAVEWDYFSARTDEIAKISLGGMAWHGALLLGLPAALLAAQVRGVPAHRWMDAAAIAWPLGASAAWLGCRRAGCGYGYEVWTLADWPGWLVEELPDVYGAMAPRLDVQAAGALWGAGLLSLALILTARGWLPGLRLWLILALTGLGHALLGFFRADPAQLLYQRRADQVFDLVLLLVATAIGGMIWLAARREPALVVVRSTTRPRPAPTHNEGDNGDEA
jgi:prolipoprotein diacylglyceryltransferase